MGVRRVSILGLQLHWMCLAQSLGHGERGKCLQARTREPENHNQDICESATESRSQMDTALQQIRQRGIDQRDQIRALMDPAKVPGQQIQFDIDAFWEAGSRDIDS